MPSLTSDRERKRSRASTAEKQSERMCWDRFSEETAALPTELPPDWTGGGWSRTNDPQFVITDAHGARSLLVRDPGLEPGHPPV